jgi:hypothetical protein
VCNVESISARQLAGRRCSGTESTSQPHRLTADRHRILPVLVLPLLLLIPLESLGVQVHPRQRHLAASLQVAAGPCHGGRSCEASSHTSTSCSTMRFERHQWLVMDCGNCVDRLNSLRKHVESTQLNSARSSYVMDLNPLRIALMITWTHTLAQYLTPQVV